MRIALIGTRGVPARYGGFETAVEEIGSRLASRGHEVVVFCRVPEGEQPLSHYMGMTLVNLPSVKKRSLETLSHTALSVVSPALAGVEAAVVFNAANSPLLPVLRARRIPVATHVDGLEWQRSKWGRAGRGYYRVAESLSVKLSEELIADAQGIADYYTTEFSAPTRLIAYGAPILDSVGHDRLAELELTRGKYHLVVARFEQENHVLEIVEGYVQSHAKRPLVVVGSAPYADAYTHQIQAVADERVRLLGGVWDQELLNQLYAHSLTYLHGHSVGGTNPSLLRAAGAGAMVIAFDVSFNREVVAEHGEYFATPSDVASYVEAVEADPQRSSERGQALRQAIRRYSWETVADQYEKLLIDLSAGQKRWRDRPSGVRRRTGGQV